MWTIRLSIAATALLTISAPAVTRADETATGDRGGVLALSCAACHGPAGRSPGAIPSLHGLTVESIRRALREFKQGTREGTVMNRLAQGYTDAEIEALARYFGGQK